MTPMTSQESKPFVWLSFRGTTREFRIWLKLLTVSIKRIN